MDLEKKGYLVVEDLVRLMNLEGETFVRNRDLVLIFRRVGGGRNRVLWGGVMRRICVGGG